MPSHIFIIYFLLNNVIYNFRVYRYHMLSFQNSCLWLKKIIFHLDYKFTCYFLNDFAHPNNSVNINFFSKLVNYLDNFCNCSCRRLRNYICPSSFLCIFWLFEIKKSCRNPTIRDGLSPKKEKEFTTEKVQSSLPYKR